MRIFIKRSIGFLLVAAVAAGMLVFSNINVTRSALKYESELYKGKVIVKNIGVTLLENETFIARRDNVQLTDNEGADTNGWDKSDNDGDTDADGVLLGAAFSDNDAYLRLGQTYQEELAVYNSGDIPQYCRMIIRKYWTDSTGKRVDLDPDLIDLQLSGKWQVEESWSDDGDHPETTVLFYPVILQPDEVSAPATTTLKVDGLVAKSATMTTTDNGNGTKTVRTVYDYDGVYFNIEVEADAVQTHNASDAMKSAWGNSYL